MALTLLQIPPELISCILLYLSARDILSCRLTCRTLYDLSGSSPMRYLVQMERSAVTDDVRPGLSYPERLRILEKREEAWEVLDFRRSVQVCVPFASTGIYDFTGGAFLLGTRLSSTSRRLTEGYSYLPLPSLSSVGDQKLEWVKLGLGVQVLDVGLAVHEHDLIAALTACVFLSFLLRKADKNISFERRMTFEIQLLSFSTGQPHPLAQQPIIFITTKSVLLGHCNVLIEVVGDFLALLITFPWARNENEGHCFEITNTCNPFAYHVQLRSSEWGAYSYFSFLTQDTLVIPNLVRNTLELVKIVIDNDDIPRLATLCVLNLPPLTRRASIVRLGCRAEPNPTGTDPLAIPAPSSRPFRDRAEDAIILFHMMIEDVQLHPGQFHFPDMRPFAFIVHRRALVEQIPAAYRTCPPFGSTPEPERAPVPVPWAAWGVAVTRWFEGDPASMRWITTTAGQRAVTMEDGIPTPIIVRDFNPYAVRSIRARAVASGQDGPCDWSAELPNGNRMTLKVEESVIAAGSVFIEDVRSSLPYVEIVTWAEYQYEGVLIDEERILGLKVRIWRHRR
ncbi:hypothetical protein F5148DRAFT_982664 [Russula earlei]|uniref:Uncharacterized protein n=1 Tax=Russula earlei TaxID=71964 RepID=A0ACC0U4D6_9AGAM|nr:hypothetical protein F5148DRAFT_982664 [Russula earlei]